MANGFEIYELHHNGEHYVAEIIQRHETQVVMNAALKTIDKRSLLVVGQESHSQMFVITTKMGQLPIGRRGSSSDVRQRNPDGRQIDAGVGANPMKRIFFEIKTADSIQTDFMQPEPLQKVVRISLRGKFMATGGNQLIVFYSLNNRQKKIFSGLDGHVRGKC